jgi:hypothetical protein
VKTLQIQDGSTVFLSDDVFAALAKHSWRRKGAKVVRQSDNLPVEVVAAQYRRDEAQRLLPLLDGLGQLDREIALRRLQGASALAIAEEVGQPVAYVLGRIEALKRTLSRAVASCRSG